MKYLISFLLSFSLAFGQSTSQSLSVHKVTGVIVAPATVSADLFATANGYARTGQVNTFTDIQTFNSASGSFFKYGVTIGLANTVSGTQRWKDSASAFTFTVVCPTLTADRSVAWPDQSGTVAFTNSNITGNAGGLNGVAMSSLATGIVKNTTGTGVPSIAVAGDFPTLNQNTTGSAATLTTGRTVAITGDGTYTSGSFNGSANVTGTIAVTKMNGVSMAGLATGIVKNTTATGAPSIAAAGTDYLAPAGSGQALTNLPCEFCVAASDETTAITTGTGKVTFRAPYAFVVTAVRASVNTAPTGSTILIDINETGTTIISTKLMIDATEKTSQTAATPYVISDANIADDAEISVDFDQVGSTIAGAGVKIWLIGHR